MTLSGILWVLGMGLVFVGEQIIGEGMTRWVVDLVGVAVVASSFVFRGAGLQNKDASVKDGALKSLIMAGVATLSLGLYALGTNEFTDLLGFADEGRVRWQGVLSTLTPITLLIGAVPMFFLDLVLSSNPVRLPRDAARRALISGLSASIAIALIFPVNYLASHSEAQIETSYFRTAKPGEATQAMVSELTEPVQVFLFFPNGNEVLEELRGYFAEVGPAAGDNLSIEVKDQALAMGLAEELKLNDNGWVVLKRGEEQPVKFKMQTELKRSKRDLRRFDELFQKNLLKVTRGTLNAYFVVGHGEASHKVKDDDWRKLSKLRKELQNQSYKLKDLGLVQGLAEKVPDDADVVILASPDKPLLPEEEQSLITYLDGGGQLLVMVDARSNALPGLLGHLGLAVNPGPIADPKKRLRNASPYIVLTDRYGTHSAVSAMAKSKQPVILPGPVGFTETSGGQGKPTVLLRSYGSAFADQNLNGRQDPEETTKVHNLAYAVEGGEGETQWRAVVIGNQAFVSDQAVRFGWVTGPAFAVDGLRWLAGEESVVGETESEEDIKIDHSPGGQKWWFWGTIFAVPLLILGLGITRFLVRRRTS